MLIKRQLIIGTPEEPLMDLEEHQLSSKDYNFKEAEQELHNHAKEKSPDDLIWGYFPNMENDEGKLYPECIKLSNLIKINLFQKDLNLELSFVKFCLKKPKAEFGGLHLDTGFKMHDKNMENKDIERILINASHYTRKLKFCPLSIAELKEKGIILSSKEYNPIKLPENIPIRIIEIPPRNENSIYILRFTANKVLHVGINDENGYFLISYGKYK